ncbi:hypothetical protein QJS66_18820 [Kocuria rhizophila]|nr:hypothetical protein QJS66_18820 [Kocuria rhizophila]
MDGETNVTVPRAEAIEQITAARASRAARASAPRAPPRPSPRRAARPAPRRRAPRPRLPPPRAPPRRPRPRPDDDGEARLHDEGQRTTTGTARTTRKAPGEEVDLSPRARERRRRPVNPRGRTRTAPARERRSAHASVRPGRGSNTVHLLLLDVYPGSRRSRTRPQSGAAAGGLPGRGRADHGRGQGPAHVLRGEGRDFAVERAEEAPAGVRHLGHP